MVMTRESGNLPETVACSGRRGVSGTAFSAKITASQAVGLRRVLVFAPPVIWPACYRHRNRLVPVFWIAMRRRVVVLSQVAQVALFRLSPRNRVSPPS